MRIRSGAAVVNSNHDFKKGDIISPGIFMKLVYADFPPGCIHILSLHIESRLREKYILATHRDMFFLAPDNGVLPIVFGEEEAQWYQLTDPEAGADVFRTVYMPALEKLIASGFQPAKAFIPESRTKKLLLPSPTLSGNIMRLTVLYNDAHGNAYLNIDKSEFLRITEGKKFSIRLGFKDSIDNISPGTETVPEGQKLAYFGPGNLLQIAVNSGSAAQYLGLVKGKNVMLEIQ